MNYSDLEIWKLANEIAIEIHLMTIEELPDFEKFETGSQIRRSSKSVRSNIVEGFGRRSSKKEFLVFLRYAHASNDETLDHLISLHNTGSLRNHSRFEKLKKQIDLLGRKLYCFIKSVQNNHKT